MQASINTFYGQQFAASDLVDIEKILLLYIILPDYVIKKFLKSSLDL